jgi:hypothetical protein
MQRRKTFEKIYAAMELGPFLGEHFKPLEGRLGAIGNAIVTALPSPLPFSVAFGIVEAREINARAYRAKQGAAAVCLNASIPLLLNKLIKLRIAYERPQLVTYYNRSPFRQMTKHDYADLARAQLIAYRESREIRGPYIELNEVGIVWAGAALMAAESYLLGHEIAHLGMSSGSFGMSEQELLDLVDLGNEGLAREIVADVLGAMMAREATLAYAGNISFAVPLGAGRLYELLTVAGKPSPHYAPPALRAAIIIRIWFGDELVSQFTSDEMAEEWLSLDE